MQIDPRAGPLQWFNVMLEGFMRVHIFLYNYNNYKHQLSLSLCNVPLHLQRVMFSSTPTSRSEYVFVDILFVAC